MLEIVAAIRNNNVKKIPNYDPMHQAHLQKISRFKSWDQYYDF
jgi:nucleolar MIF4G domain-containing protein 1